MAANRGEEIRSSIPVAQPPSAGSRTPPRVAVPHRRKWFWRAILACLLAAVLCYAGLRYHWRHEFRVGIEAIRAAGYPVNLEELDKWYTWPESGENAASWILEAMARYSAPSEEADGWSLWFLVRDPPSARTKPLDDALRSLLTRHITANAEPLKLLHQAAAMGHSRYPVDLKRGFNVTLPHHSSVVQASALLSHEAIFHVEDSNVAGGVRSIIAALAMADSLSSEPCFLSQSNRVHCQSLTLCVLERIVNRVELADEQLVLLDEALARAYRPNAWLRAMVGEQCMVLAAHQRPELLDARVLDPEIPPLVVVGGYRAIGLMDRSGAIFVNLMKDSAAIWRLPVHERMGAARSVDEKRRAAPRTCFLVHQCSPYALPVTQEELTEVARLAVADAALAIERYRLSHGRLPVGLDDLVADYVPQVPQDPFDGKPLRYKRLERGYVVYSIGPDQTDEGGKERPPVKRGDRSSAPAYDITFIVER